MFRQTFLLVTNLVTKLLRNIYILDFFYYK